jgi:eukaryotic-like serine/threonine-protein kinase
MVDTGHAARLPQSSEFEVLSTLGKGGMGVVYRAREKATGREVALKVVLDAMSPVRLERFRREGELVARLSHPGIVKVHSSGEMEGKPFLACELVDGARTLGDLFHQVGLKHRVALVRDASRALGHAHQAGISHRDVKPDNILVDRSGAVKVTDFGLASAEDLERLTKSNVVLGTPHFMPPEQFRPGKHKEQGPPGDVWSLGVCLYKGLTGKMPFEGGTVPELSAKITSVDPVPPSQLNAAVPPSLEAICLKTLQRDPGRRYPDGEALAKDLEAWLEQRPVSARPAGPLARLLAGRTWLLLPLLALVVVLVLAAVYRPAASAPAPPPAPAR